MKYRHLDGRILKTGFHLCLTIFLVNVQFRPVSVIAQTHSNLYTVSDLKTLRLGLGLALEEGEISHGGNFHDAIEDAFILIERGQTASEASQRTGVFLAVFNKLYAKGKNALQDASILESKIHSEVLTFLGDKNNSSSNSALEFKDEYEQIDLNDALQLFLLEDEQ